MFSHVKHPQMAEVCANVRGIIDAKRSPLFSVIKSVEPANDEEHPHLVLPVSGVSAPNRDMAGARLAKALTEELTLAPWSTPSCVASLAMHPTDGDRATPTVSGIGVNIDRLSQFLAEHLERTGLRPYNINLITVTFGRQWSYLSLVCPRVRYGAYTPKEREGAYRDLRQELLEQFDVRLRLVVTAPQPRTARVFVPGIPPHTSGLAQEQFELPYGSSDPASLERYSPQRPRSPFVSDWSTLHLCSIDSKGTRRFEDIIGEGPDGGPEHQLVDLRVCMPLALREFQSLTPHRGVLPALGMQTLLGATGDVAHRAVRIVEARNAEALDVREASAVLQRMNNEEIKHPAEEFLMAPKTLSMLSRLPQVVARIHMGQLARGEVDLVTLGRIGPSESQALMLSKAEVLVQRIMRFSQSCILNWRDTLASPPSLLVSRPEVLKDQRAERLLKLLGCNTEELLDPRNADRLLMAIRHRDAPGLEEMFSQVVHDAYCNRRLQLVDPSESCRPGDILPIKRGRFGYLNNLQVASAVLSLEPLPEELLRRTWKASRRSKSLDKRHERQLSEAIQERQAELFGLLF
jgi:hypothetical protein